MNYYVISPNADGHGSDAFIPDIMKRHVALMGWDVDNDLGKRFANIRKGDRVLIAQGANRNKKVYAIGIADSNSCKGELTTQEVHLSPFIQGESLLKNIPFNENCTCGSSNRIKAIYELKSYNSADKKVIETIEYLLKQKNMIEELENNYNIILHGAPGTGKTYLAREMAKAMKSPKIGFVQFHPSYDYTDFVEGLRPTPPQNNQIGFERKDGEFKSFCKMAIKSPEDKFVFIIDEINRGDMSKIFGELFFSIDPGYRGNEEQRVKTQYQNMITDRNDCFYDGFYVPSNVYIIGTMNDIDRSVESMDFAMRRRFAFHEITAEDSQSMLTTETFKTVKPNVAVSNDEINIIKRKMDALNEAIITNEIGLSTDYQIGAAYFLKYALYKEGNNAIFEKLWNNHLKSILTEYLRGTGDEKEKMEKLFQAYNK